MKLLLDTHIFLWFISGDKRLQHQIISLTLDESSVSQLAYLPPIHRDPFDRMLICQAIAHGLTILTADDTISEYDVSVLPIVR